MFLDNELILANEKAIAALEVKSDAVKVGPSGPFANRAKLMVRLTTPFTTGTIASVALQTCATETGFDATGKTLVTVTLNDTAAQAKACKLFAIELPEECLDWIRIVVPAQAERAGGKLFAAVVTEDQLKL